MTNTTKDLKQASLNVDKTKKEKLRTKVVKDGCRGCPSAPLVCSAPDSPADTAPAAAIAAEVTVDAFEVGGAAASAAPAGAGDEAFLSGGLKYTGKGFPPMGPPFSSMLSYGIQQIKGLSIRLWTGKYHSAVEVSQVHISEAT